MSIQLYNLSELPQCQDFLSLHHTFKHYSYPVNSSVKLTLSMSLKTFCRSLDCWKTDERGLVLTKDELVVFRRGANEAWIPRRRVLVTEIEGLGVDT